MVTTNVETDRTFTLRVSEGKDGLIRIIIDNERGESRYYTIPRNKLLPFTIANGPVRSAVDFLLGETNA